MLIGDTIGYFVAAMKLLCLARYNKEDASPIKIDSVEDSYLSIARSSFQVHGLMDSSLLMEAELVILLNGVSNIWFLHRGVRQGDPLSLCLFISVSHFSTRIMEKSHLNGLILGVIRDKANSEVVNNFLKFCRAQKKDLENCSVSL